MIPSDNPSAFPLNSANAANPGAFDPEPGMSMRDWFAGQALSGILANAATRGNAANLAPTVAEVAYRLADAMLTERAKAGAA